MTRRRKIGYFLGGMGLAALLSFGLYWFFYLRYIKYTNDAYVHGNQVYITPIHQGFVTSIHTDDSFLVRQGQLLVTLDETDAKIDLERAKEVLAQTVRQVCELFHQVFVYKAEIDLKTTELIRNTQDYLHRLNVFQEQGISLEDFEHAIAALKTQFYSLEMSGALYYKTLSAVQNTSIRQHPLVMAAADNVRNAWVRLRRCRIYSPVDGLAAQRTIQVGMQVNEGQILMSVIPLDQMWINANYKETQMKYMRLGQKVDITTDLWGDKQIYHGTIVGIPGGAGNAFSLLPPENLSGNWIKIVQRLPVRVALDPDEIKQFPLRLGLSCQAIVNTKDHQGLIIPQTNTKAPCYKTIIFDNEERGDQEIIDIIINENLDPLLSNYSHKKLSLPYLQINFPPLLEKAIRQDERLKQEIYNPPSGNLSLDVFKEECAE